VELKFKLCIIAHKLDLRENNHVQLPFTNLVNKYFIAKLSTTFYI